MYKDISPEEKLLSIIKGKQNIPESGASKPDIKDNKPLPRARWSKIDDYVLTVLKNDFLKNSILDARALKIFNKYAVIIAALIAGYLILDLILVSPSRNAARLITKASLSGPLVVSAQMRMPIETKGYSYYSNRMSGRNIFSGGSYIQTESQAAGMDPSAELSGGNLGLVGIIPGANPQAIVEDKKNQKTYYLLKGQSINGITVEDINEDKVVLEYRGKKMTLFL
jgi:hypothetical protein